MKTSRMEAFSDGVLAIVITIMVLELKVPHGTDWPALRPLLPVFGSYVMSFVYIGIYWNNHHNLLHVTESIDGNALWANLHLLFWLSLFPLTTGWMGENSFAPLPTALYGLVLLMASLAWVLLQSSLVACAASNQRLKQAVGRDFKGKVSIALYAIGTIMALVQPWVAISVYVGIAVLWFIPDRRFERAANGNSDSSAS